MPSKLRAWFDHLGTLDHLDKQDTTLQRAFAVVIYHTITADDIETAKEKQRFASFFKQDFGLSDEQVSALHDEASRFDDDFEIYLDVLKEKIAVYPEIELKLMQVLNRMLTSHPFSEKEYEVFERIKLALFPKS
ncbi:TerB family tellurite resistance protein [Leucothrix pacifica]|uniref:Co-chaperone DjlA N-terminal domain-containing protein n=1 Tax=Leucothrix pacifica TaxID=1247513 RepID=A0A317CMZ4_9GAMM|nr:TerB family tellurite resistance protein [Leucothrix pacifica]PWQ98833.1 hypothetical protein DKW60_07255 [Leucothrix pacifica]